MPRRLDLSMLEDTPGPRRTPLVHKVVDRMLPKKQRERCEKHCLCVSDMRVKVNFMFFLACSCLAYFIPREIYGWMHARDLPPIISTTTNGRP